MKEERRELTKTYMSLPDNIKKKNTSYMHIGSCVAEEELLLYKLVVVLFEDNWRGISILCLLMN
jgi:hypothetical protein